MSHFKKVSVTALALALSASAFAGPDLDTRVHDLEKQMKQVRTETASQTYGANTATARPNVHGYGFFLTFDILYWQTKVGGTEYALTDQDTLGVMPVSGKYRGIDFKWDWAFRAGIGYNFLHGEWDLYADYTYYKNNTCSMVTGELNGSVIPQRGSRQAAGGGSQFNSVNKATSEYKFEFDRIDLELGRNYYISRDLSFRPHFGLVTAWINQKQLTRYTGGPTIGVNTVHVKDRNDFWGIGPRTGVNSKWHFTDGFSIMGNVSGALVYGNFGVRHKNWLSSDPVTHQVNVSANMHRFTPTASLQLGLAYDRYIYNDKQHIGISLSWDTQYWWRMNQMLNCIEDQPLKYIRQSDDISIQGITLNLRLDF